MVMENPVNSGPDISVVVPVYNEIGNLDSLVERVRTTLDEMGLTWELLAVDDGSTDGSGERLDDMAMIDSALPEELRPVRGSRCRIQACPWEAASPPRRRSPNLS